MPASKPEPKPSPSDLTITLRHIGILLGGAIFAWLVIVGLLSLEDEAEIVPVIDLVGVADSNNNYQVKVIRVSENFSLSDYRYSILTPQGDIFEWGEIALQNVSGQWWGIDVTWDTDITCSGDCRNEPRNQSQIYSDALQAQIRIDGVKAGWQANGTYQRGEGRISVIFSDNDRDGKLSAGDQFLIRANTSDFSFGPGYTFELIHIHSGKRVAAFTPP